MYAALRGCLAARRIALFKIRWGNMPHDMVYCLAGVEFMSLVDSRRPSDVHGQLTIQCTDVTPELKIVDIRMIIALAHLIRETDRRSLVNSRIDLRSFDEIYTITEGAYIIKETRGAT